MKTIEIKVSEADLQKYDLGGRKEINFSDLIEKISLEYARQALMECNILAKKAGLSKMSQDEIDAEIQAVRDAKSNS